MAKLYDWVKQEVSGTPGTGAITLSTAVSTFITFSDAGITNGEMVYYTIVDGSNRERGIGTYSTTGPTLTRTLIQGKLESGTYTANPGTGLSLTSAAIVGCSPVSATHNFRGCELALTSNQSIPDSIATTINWDTEIIDTDGFHESVTNPNRITIPSGLGIEKVEIVFSGVYSANSTGDRSFYIFDSSGAIVAGLAVPTVSPPKAQGMATTGVIAISDGDWFECEVYQNSGGNLDFESDLRSRFKLKVIE